MIWSACDRIDLRRRNQRICRLFVLAPGGAVTDPADLTTRLLNRLVDGDASAAEELMPVVYGELRGLAERHMVAQRSDHTLQPTALIHEAWMRIGAQEDVRFECRAQFFSLASRVMRSVLVDHARARSAAKREGDRIQLELGDDNTVANTTDLVELDDALAKLQEVDGDLVRLVELRFFGGLSHPEISEAMGLSLRRVERLWRLARAWLHAELSP